MSKIDAKVFVKIWDEVANKEHLTDRGLSIKIGITPSAVTHWRLGRTAHVRPEMLRKLEEKFGYVVEFRKDGTWRLYNKKEQLSDATARRETRIDQRDHHSRESLTRPQVLEITADDTGVQFKEEGYSSPLLDDHLAGTVWMRMAVDSKNPFITKKSWILVSKRVRPRSGDLALIAVKGNKTPILGVVTIDEDKHEIRTADGKLVSLNPEDIASEHRVLAIVFPDDTARGLFDSDQWRDHQTNKKHKQSTDRKTSQEE